MQLEGTFTVKAGRTAAYRFLIDPSQFARHMPDLEEVKVEDENHFTMKAKVGISHIKGTMSMKLELVEKEEPVSAKVIGKGAGLASVVDMVTTFKLEEAEGGMTKIRWFGEASVGGKIAALGGGLLERLAKKNLEKFIAGIQQGIESLPA
ncbi:MAG: carbon monoxide dehydrogenase subunit G [Acidobacteria bacterium]|nr:carbon monoxide dehydrogenase subunit G [Acidobacteriota bacterium]